MKPLARVRGVEELLDAPDQDETELAASLAHVAAVNRYLGGERSLIEALQPYLYNGVRLLDAGTGSGDLPIAITQYARARRIGISITAIDVHPQTLAIAQRNCQPYPEIHVAAANALQMDFPNDAFDAVLFSLVLHHFDDDTARAALREAGRVAPIIIVSELHRTHLNYAGARLLAATLWRDNPITRHDGPLSVLRAYRPAELRALADSAGLNVRSFQRRWFQRLVMVAGRS